jgi:hypothetical protein
MRVGANMARMPSLEHLIGQAAEAWEPAVERAIFGTGEPQAVAHLIEEWVTAACGPIAEAVFYRPGVGIVAGLRLVSGAEVVIKVHRWNASADRLRAMQMVQARIAAHDKRAPRPLAGPQALGRGLATVEELRRGESGDRSDRALRQEMAHVLHRFIRLAAPLVGQVDVGPALMLRPPGAPLWFEPHDVRFDFAATAEGAQWIDELATAARHRIDQCDDEMVIGHFDWRIQNLGFTGSQIVAIYDWDSVALASEAMVVGNTAAQFTADWSSDDPDPLPSVDEMRAFVTDYEQARGKPFDGAERQALDAANLFMCAYGARCQHSDMARHPQLSRGIPGWIRLLRERGDWALIA